MNLIVVFFLCGLWHGARWTFVVWGLYHGAFLVLERVGAASWLARLPRVMRHAYLLLVVMVGWVFFRAGTLGQAWAFLGAMVGVGGGRDTLGQASQLLRRDVVLAVAAGVIGAAPLVPWLSIQRERLQTQRGTSAALLYGTWELGAFAATLALLFACAALLASGTYNPFIYFRF